MIVTSKQNDSGHGRLPYTVLGVDQHSAPSLPRCMSRSYGAAARSSWGLLMWQILVICRTVPSGDKLFIRNQVGTHSFLPAPAPELPPPRATGPPRGRSKLLGSI
jgi:hypothetical protein